MVKNKCIQVLNLFLYHTFFYKTNSHWELQCQSKVQTFYAFKQNKRKKDFNWIGNREWLHLLYQAIISEIKIFGLVFFFQ